MSYTVPNKNINDDAEDVLYHLGLANGMDLKAMFSDTKFVCMGGSAVRAERLANQLIERLNIPVPAGLGIVPVGKTERFSLFKVGPVISVNHGMGMPSMSILLHEIAKLLQHAGASKDVIFVRIGTSGGVGVEPGTVVVADEGYNAELEPCYKYTILSKVHKYPTTLDEGLVKELLECAKGDGTDKNPPIACIRGKTMGTDDFYEGQARVDGALCDHSEKDKFEWLQKLYDTGIRNIEMEAPCFASFCNRAKVRGILCNAVLLNRLKGDQVTSTPAQLKAISTNAQEVVLRLIEKHLSNNNNDNNNNNNSSNSSDEVKAI